MLQLLHLDVLRVLVMDVHVYLDLIHQVVQLALVLALVAMMVMVVNDMEMLAQSLVTLVTWVVIVAAVVITIIIIVSPLLHYYFLHYHPLMLVDQ
jgi:hypothetical protein